MALHIDLSNSGYADNSFPIYPRRTYADCSEQTNARALRRVACRHEDYPMSAVANKILTNVFLTHFEKADTSQILDMMSDEATWWVNGKPHLFPFAGSKTKAEMRSVFEELFAFFDGGLKMEVKSLIAEGDRVAAEACSYGVTKTGKHYANDYHMLFRFNDGKLVEVREYTDPMHAVEVLN
jgi:ketosteroid isomerase-like protein